VIGKWEEGKKWQKRVETLKAQCREKDVEIEKLKKNSEMLRHAVDRSVTLRCLVADSHNCVEHISPYIGDRSRREGPLQVSSTPFSHFTAPL